VRSTKAKKHPGGDADGQVRIAVARKTETRQFVPGQAGQRQDGARTTP